MAWPLTPLTTYLQSSLPAIKAFDLNAIQDAITRIVRGTYTLFGLVLDGTGGGNAIPPAGGIVASGVIRAGELVSAGPVSATTATLSANIFAGAAPTADPGPGTLYADTVPFAAAMFGPGGDFHYGFNVASITSPRVGVYEVKFIRRAVTNWGGSFGLLPVASVFGVTGIGTAVSVVDANTLLINTFATATGNPVAAGIYLLVFGR